MMMAIIMIMIMMMMMMMMIMVAMIMVIIIIMSAPRLPISASSALRTSSMQVTSPIIRGIMVVASTMPVSSWSV